MSVKDIIVANTADMQTAIDVLSQVSDKTGLYVWKKLTAKDGELVAYATSDASSSYPNGGTQDGYWYELVKEGSSVTIDGEPYDGDLALVKRVVNLDISSLPFRYTNGSAIIYKDEIHLMGGDYYSDDYIYSTKHYKWNGSSWINVSTLPFAFYNGGCSVVYKNALHILGGVGDRTKHYRWNGSSWASVSTLPYDFYGGGRAVVYNNEIHIFGSGVTSSSDKSYHYKWDGSSWTSVGSLPKPFIYGGVAVFNGELYIFGGDTSSLIFYKWDGSSWISLGSLPTSFSKFCSISLDDGIYLLRTSDISVWDGNAWTTYGRLPYSAYYSSVVFYNNRLCLLGGTYNDLGHYMLECEVYLK